MTEPTPPSIPPAYSSTSSPPKEPFIYQIAKAALWSPIIALGLGICTQSILKSSPPAALVVGSVNGLLILFGFICSIITLIAVFKFGPRQLLFRGIIGFFFSSALLAVFIFLYFGLLNLSSRLETRLAGKWQDREPGALVETLTLDPNKNFHLEVSGPGGAATLDGTWQAGLHNDLLYLVLHPTAGTGPLAENIGHDIAFQIQSTQDNQLTLLDNNQPKTYNRLP